MATKAELITAFRKENEDLTQANVRSIFKAKYGSQALVIGNNEITLVSSVADEAYTDPNDYEIRFQEVVDSDGIDIIGAIYVASKTATSFTVSSPREGTIKWETYLKVPNFNFWT